MKVSGIVIKKVAIVTNGGGGGSQTEAVDVTLSFNPGSLSLKYGQTVDGPAITATANNSTVTGLTYSYASGDTNIATVNNSTGAVTGVGVGETTITVSWGAITGYNSGSTTYNVVVGKADGSISFNPSSVNLTFGETFTAPTATTTPANATITYSTSDSKIAIIDDNGNVVPVGAGTDSNNKAVSSGTATITGTFADNGTYNGATSSYTITVSAPTTEGAVWQGAVWLGSWGNGGSQPLLPTSAFSSVEDGDQLQIYAKIGPLNATNWNLQFFPPTWGEKTQFIDIHQASNPISNGYITVDVTEAIATALKVNNNGNCAVVNGYNLTITAIKIIKAEAPQAVTDNWSASSSTSTDASVLKEDAALKIQTLSATTRPNDSRAILGKQFNQYITVRNENGSDGTANSAVSIEAKQNTTIVVYYRRQSDQGDYFWRYTSGDGKDVKLLDSSNNNVAGAQFEVNDGDAGYKNYAFVAKKYSLTGGNTYTLTSSGTTVRLYGIYYSTDASNSNVQIDHTYKLTYMNGDNLFGAIWLKASATIPALSENPTKDNYTFTGWTNADGAALPSTMPAYDYTAYAQFTQNGPTENDFITVEGWDSYAGQYRTYVTTAAVDFSKSVGVKGYYATGLSSDGETVEFTEVVSVVPANTPLLLYKTGTAAKLYKANHTAAAPSPNKLVAGNGSAVGNSNIYVLTYHSNGYVFAETNYNSAIVDASHAYLDLRGSNARGRLKIKIGNDTAGINDIESNEQGAKVIYDLRGQRVERPTKGIYIINGKKTVIK